MLTPTVASYAGLGLHFATLDFDMASKFMFRFYVANATYITSTTLLKLSLLCQYLRIFKDGILRTSCFVLISFCLVWGCISSFMAWFPCFPIKAYWDWSIVDANCYAFGSKIEGPFVQTYVSHAAFNLVLDFAILVLPAPIIFQKALSGKQKLSALGLGAMGMLVIAFCAWRLAEVVIHGAGFKPVMDFTYYGPSMIMLVSLEIYVAILAVSMPVFWPILQQSFGGIVVRHEVQVTSRHVSAFEELEDGDTKSEHGSETALGPERNQKGKRGFYTEDLEMEQFGGPGKNNVRIGARRGSQGSLVDSTTYERLR